MRLFATDSFMVHKETRDFSLPIEDRSIRNATLSRYRYKREESHTFHIHTHAYKYY